MKVERGSYFGRCLFLIIGILGLPTLQAQKLDSVSYSLGLLVGRNLVSQGFDQLDPVSLAEGMKAALQRQSPLWEEEEANRIIQMHVDNKEKNKYADQVAAEEAFFRQNAKQPGVISLASGLQYQVIQSGTGPSPKPTDKVTTHYHGTLISGEVFDSSVERGQPATFEVNAVIDGWTEALQLMKVGDKWRLFVPSSLAYGARGVGQKIGPFTPLVFEVELISIL